MKTQEFQLSESDEYIELIKLLKYLQIAESGADAKILVESGKIKHNGEIELRKRAKLRNGDIIEARGYKVTILK